MRLKALIGATSLALAAGATLAWQPEPRAAPPAMSGVPAPGQMAAFQAQAEKACRCARTRPDDSGKKDCWAGFDKAVAPWPHGTEGSLCEFSLQGICFGDGLDASDACIARSWSGPVGGPGSICTPAELQTAEAIFYEAVRQHAKDPTKAPPEEVLKRTLAAFARNDRIAFRRASGGCGGG
jgi:hypothetical protein